MQRWNALEDKYVAHYVIGRTGNIYNCVSEDYWTKQTPMSRRKDIDSATIGITLSNEMYLMKENGNFYAFAIPKQHNLYKGPVFEYEAKGYKHWADYEKFQITALCELLNDLCDRHHISKTMFADTMTYLPRHSQWREAGIISHANVNSGSFSLPLPEWVKEQIQSSGIELV